MSTPRVLQGATITLTPVPRERSRAAKGIAKVLRKVANKIDPPKARGFKFTNEWDAKPILRGAAELSKQEEHPWVKGAREYKKIMGHEL